MFVLETRGTDQDWLSTNDFRSEPHVRKGHPAVLTRLTVRNFKRFKELDIELDSSVVFVGPNDCGKTSAMQALALWDVGVRRWNEKYAGRGTPTRRPGVTINRRDLVTIPIPSADHLWLGRRTRRSQGTVPMQRTENIRIEITVEGVTSDKEWKCGLEFDYANPESLYCRPLRIPYGERLERFPVPREVQSVRIAYLPPISGLAGVETRLDSGAINVRVGEGRTAEVLRNLCLSIHQKDVALWKSLVDRIETLFGCVLLVPQSIPERGEIVMTYIELGTRYDISSSGRGLQQTLLILAYMYANPNSVIVLDEPDAHLEILRQRQTYRLISEVAATQGNQIIVATHSEVLLNEAVSRDTVIAFVGTPHPVEDRRNQRIKSLKNIGFEDYIQAKQTQWVLYLEESTDLAILQEFSKVLNHQGAQSALERPFVHYFGNRQSKSADHFHGLRKAVPQLRGVALFDRLEANTIENGPLVYLTWNRREIENYFCSVKSLESFASHSDEASGSTFSSSEKETRINAMRGSIREVENAMITLGRGSPWDIGSKVSDDFLTPVFERYFEKLELPNLMRKGSLHRLVRYMNIDDISPEVTEKLDEIARIARQARIES